MAPKPMKLDSKEHEHDKMPKHGRRFIKMATKPKTLDSKVHGRDKNAETWAKLDKNGTQIDKAR